MEERPSELGGYHQQMLRVNLTDEDISKEYLEERTLRKFIGGSGLGVNYLYDEVDSNIEWSDENNRLIFSAGPLNGTKMMGSGGYSVVSKGPLTGGVADTQAQGHFGSNLKFCGFDGIVIQGKLTQWKYLFIGDEEVELRDAEFLEGKDTYETEYTLQTELENEKISVASIGPAGENLVKFAGIFNDEGHAAPHNGIGAVMGSKKLKAVVIENGTHDILVSDEDGLQQAARDNWEVAGTSPIYEEGTLFAVEDGYEEEFLPIKNYSEGEWDIDHSDLESFTAEEIQNKFEDERKLCFNCPMNHCEMHVIPEGEYEGLKMEEPEYEQITAFSSLIGNTEENATWMLSNLVDRLGMDVNEMGWIVGMIMEGFVKGIFDEEDLDGIELTWGDTEGTKALMDKVAHRDGIGDILAEGIKSASQELETEDIAICTEKGNTPRTHDHRVRRWEQIDTVISNVGTKESSTSFYATDGPDTWGEVIDKFEEHKGKQQFEDSLVTCTFHTRTDIPLLSEAVSAVTGWDLTPEEAAETGRRILNLSRAFNNRHGLVGKELDRPSTRYGSAAMGGDNEGETFMNEWDTILDNYYEVMGWDKKSGKPLPETLENLGIGTVANDIWEKPPHQSD